MRERSIRGSASKRSSAIRVLVVDDHRLVTDAIKRLLGQEDDMVVVGAIGEVAALRGVTPAPDVILMDYMLADGTGAEATRIAKARWPRVRVLMLTSIDADETILETVQAGADGYLTKARAVAEVAAAVRSVHDGAILLPAAVITAIARRVAAGPVQEPLAAGLTARELEVLRMLAQGRSGRSIAGGLVLSVDTVRTHIQAIRRKLGAHTRLEAVAIALQRQLIEPPGR